MHYEYLKLSVSTVIPFKTIMFLLWKVERKKYLYYVFMLMRKNFVSFFAKIISRYGFLKKLLICCKTCTTDNQGDNIWPNSKRYKWLAKCCPWDDMQQMHGLRLENRNNKSLHSLLW